MNLAEKLKHLPEEKQTEIQKALDIIMDVANPEKVILFGSYAKGTWVDDVTVEDGVTFAYHSDFDFLVVTKDNSEKEYTLKSKIENSSSSTVKGIVSALVHSIEYINEGLSYDQYFFKQIIEEGIILFDSGKYEFIQPSELSSKQQKDRAQEFFDIWFPMGQEFLIDGENGIRRGSYRKATFEFHQTLEHFYATVLLVFTGYKPKSHNLENLRDYSKHISQDLYQLFLTPTDDLYEIHVFNLLKRGYIDARYKLSFDVAQEECAYMLEKANKMKEIVVMICSEELKRLGSLA